MTARAAIAVEPLDEAVDHLRGPSAGHLILVHRGGYDAAQLSEALGRP
jgi:hypothetical protein